MEFNDFLGLVKRKKQTIGSLLVIFLIVGIILTAVQPFKYSSNLKLLVFQSTNSQVSTDPYAVTRANEYLSGILAKITLSNSFYSRVVITDFAIEQNYFGATPKQQSKQWQKTVSAKSMGDTGIIDITAYHTNRAQAEQVARAVGHVLMTQHINYHGLGDSVKIKLLDEPITSIYPVRPNIVVNLLLSIILGLVFGLSYIYLYSDKKYDIRLFTRKRGLTPDNVTLPISQSQPQVMNTQPTAPLTIASLLDQVDEPTADNVEFGKFDDDWFDGQVTDKSKEEFNPFK